METAFFWVAWGLISFWALKTFYVSFSKEKLEDLRKAALGINLAVFILTFLPWLPLEVGGNSGFTLAFEGNHLALLFITVLFASIVMFINNKTSLFKLASIATIINTVLLFVLMFKLRSGTFNLTLYDIAPIIAVILLLVNDVAVLLLWQQLQLREKIRKN